MFDFTVLLDLTWFAHYVSRRNTNPLVILHQADYFASIRLTPIANFNLLDFVLYNTIPATKPLAATSPGLFWFDSSVRNLYAILICSSTNPSPQSALDGEWPIDAWNGHG